MTQSSSSPVTIHHFQYKPEIYIYGAPTSLPIYDTDTERILSHLTAANKYIPYNIIILIKYIIIKVC